jgi:hypothetical protein
MLPLESHRWSELTHAYGPASDVPELIGQLESLPPEDGQESEPYFSLWSALCHQGDVYTGSYAAVPHIVRIIGTSPERVPWTLFLMIACIEIARNKGRGPGMPADLLEAYQGALDRVPQLVGAAAQGTWNHWYCGAALAAMAAAKGFSTLAEALLELDPETAQDLVDQKESDE